MTGVTGATKLSSSKQSSFFNRASQSIKSDLNELAYKNIKRGFIKKIRPQSAKAPNAFGLKQHHGFKKDRHDSFYTKRGSGPIKNKSKDNSRHNELSNSNQFIIMEEDDGKSCGIDMEFEKHE